MAATKPEVERRVPSQARSRERVERILDAASKLFSERGFDGTTTDAIAERAGTSVGSVYQFYPNKDAVFGAIVERHLDRARALFEVLMGSAAKGVAWERLLDRAIDGFAALDRDDPGVGAVWANWNRAQDFVIAGRALNVQFAQRIQPLLAVYAPKLPARRRPIVALSIVEVMSVMLFVAAHRSPDLAKGFLEETKLILRRYLAPYAAASRTRR